MWHFLSRARFSNRCPKTQFSGRLFHGHCIESADSSRFPILGWENRKDEIKDKEKPFAMGYLSMGKMFGSNSLSFDCISCGTRRFENRLLSFNFKCRFALVCSINFSYSRTSMMCCGEKCMIKSNRFWFANLAICLCTNSKLSTKSMDGTSSTAKENVEHKRTGQTSIVVWIHTQKPKTSRLFKLFANFSVDVHWFRFEPCRR